MKKILYLFLILLAFSFIILTILLTFNESLRRSVLNKPFSVYNLYNEYLVKVAIEKKDFDRASDIILKHLEISQKFYPGKNKMLGIVMKNINYVSSKAITQNNFNSLEMYLLKQRFFK